MAEILDDFEFQGRGGFQQKYPYDQWLNGKVWKLLEGTDYECSIGSIRACVYTAAKRRGMVARTNLIMEGKGLIIQAVPRHPSYMPDIEFGGEG